MEGKAIADGHSILKYINDTAKDYGVDKHIRFHHLVKRASWSSKDALWTVEAECGPERQAVRFTCNFLFLCSGYYSYVEGYTPVFPGSQRFAGRAGASAKMARGSSLRGQARHCDRQRRDRGYFGAGDGEDRCAGDHAAALAHLCGRAP